MAQGDVPVIEIIEYTDPVCTWCWGSEPILRRIQEVFGGLVKISFKMGGLVENIDHFYDPVNEISALDQVAPHWLEASSRHGMPVDISIFKKYAKEFKSTWPCNIAFKAAQFQGEELAVRFLRRMREAGASEGKNIQDKETLRGLAGEVGLDADRFVRDFDSPEAAEAFKRDLTECRGMGITGFPTFLVKTREGHGVLLYGHRPFETFVGVMDKILGRKLPQKQPRDIVSFVRKYGHVATREVGEVFSLTLEEAYRRLEELVGRGDLKRIPLGNGHFWEPTH